MRLQKYIASQGVCSRRKAELLIEEGRVKINGELVTELGTIIDPDQDIIMIDGKEIEKKKDDGLVYIALNKPVDYISSASDAQGSTVIDLITPNNHIGKEKKALTARVFPVGRLDKDSEGLILLTNDGELTNKLTHPRYEHEKEYEVTIGERLSKDAQAILTAGMHIDGEDLKGIVIKDISNRGKRTIVTVILTEGKNRQIRKMFGRLGYHIISLKRVRIGRLKLNSLPTGRWRFTQKSEII